jgi:hypothetical protein
MKSRRRVFVFDSSSRGNRRVEQAAIAARAHQADEQFRVGGLRALGQPDHRIACAAEIHFELRQATARTTR